MKEALKGASLVVGSWVKPVQIREHTQVNIQDKISEGETQNDFSLKLLILNVNYRCSPTKRTTCTHEPY